MRNRMDLTEGHLKLVNIPRQFWNATGRDLPEGNIKIALGQYFETRSKLFNGSYRDGQGIFIRGPSDSSKTHITVICCKALKRYGYSVYFITAGELQRCAENGDEYEEGKSVFDHCKSVDILAIDALGTEVIRFKSNPNYVQEAVAFRLDHKKNLIINTSITDSAIFNQKYGDGFVNKMLASMIPLGCERTGFNYRRAVALSGEFKKSEATAPTSAG